MRLSTTTRTRLITATSAAALASGVLAAGEPVVMFQPLALTVNNLWLSDTFGRSMAWAFDLTSPQAQVREYSVMTVAIRNDTGAVFGRGQYPPAQRGSGSSTAPSIGPTETSGVDPNTHMNTESSNGRKNGPMGAMFHEMPGNEPMGPEDGLMERQSLNSGTRTIEVIEPLRAFQRNPVVPNSSSTYTVIIADAPKLVNSQLLHVEVHFEGPSGAAVGTSPRFAVALNAADASARGLPASLARNQDPFPTDSLGPLPGSADTNNPSGTPLSAAPTATASPTGAEPSLGGAVPGTNDDNGTVGKSPNGLSTGAIAGIAVACGVVGLGLIAGLVFWLVRRRGRGASRSKDARPYGGVGGGPGSRTRELIAEKEAQSGVRESSPHSPHSDVALTGPTAALTAANLQQQQQQQDRSYTPYSDHAVAPGPPEDVTPAAAAATERHHQQQSRDLDSASSPHSPTLRPVSGADGTAGQARYAHLIEEGMTPQEIARIEEEERQLDAAIEQAARR
ncbi:uncharacterized protein E0L32_007827 [Thyridium curvatum]|uniref:Uncharacterized protein n=1 Tax=Thyridium curvatum TaxID=1093900 RepID=A0A507B3C2_9PEZI|nr:uncharacterized protein E0L32_007827 [Thyridium curvatum]TPX11408.1 hypothetical protein E0L32_007827 [Thyridium curvatum]